MSVSREETLTDEDASAGEREEAVHTSTAVIFTAVNTLAARSVRLPDLGPTDLLLHTHLTGISPVLDGPLLAGELTHLPGMTYPLVPGNAAVGEVVAKGSAVPAEWQGTLVFTGAGRAPDGMTAAWGTQCAHIVVPVDEVVPLHGLLPRTGIFLTQVGMALHSLDLAAMAPGCRVVVLGQGLLGQTLARMARLRGAERVTVADASARRLHLAMADQAIHLPAPSPWHDTQGLAEYEGEVDLLIDTTGNADLVTAWVPALRRYGALLLLAYYPRLELARLQKPRNGIRVVLSSDWTTADLVAASHLLTEGQIDLTGLISHTLPIDRVAQAFLIALGDPDALMVALTWA